MKQVSLKIKNEKGEINKICETLGRKGINITTMLGGGLEDNSFIHLITEDVNSTVKAFELEGYSPKVDDVLTVKIQDKPGELAKITRKFARFGVNVNWVYLITREKGEVTIGFQVSDLKKARKVLND